MKLAEFKRTLKAGDYVTMLSHSTMPVSHIIGQRRKVLEVRSVDILIETTKKNGSICASHLAWPKAAEFEITAEGFNYNTDCGLLTYKWERA